MDLGQTVTKGCSVERLGFLERSDPSLPLMGLVDVHQVLSVGKVHLRQLPPIRFLRANIPDPQG